MARLPEEWIHGLLDRINLHDIVARYVPLQQKGGKYWACCPFHDEKTPSFSVDPQKGFFYCFGCHKGGNAITFVSEMERTGFREACERLAEEVGMDLPSDAYSEESRQARRKRQRILDMNRDAARFYAARLYEPDGAAALSYLTGRGLTRRDIRSNGLGYAPDSWHETGRHLLSKGYTQQELVEGGLQKTRNGSTYDVFRGRVIFPIIDAKGGVVGFGGRVMDGSEPKYLNSPETAAFSKSRNLYHLNVVRSLGHVPHLLLMEGYMDVVGAAHFGVLPTVATLGTALTTEQARTLKRYDVPIYVCYDGDNAGIKAAVRACGILKDASLSARVVVFPDGKDPDEFLRANGADALRKALDGAMDPVVFRFWTLARGRDLESPDQKAEYVAQAVQVLKTERSAVRREEYARLLARQTGFSERAILEDVGQGGQEADVRLPAPTRAAPSAGPRRLDAARKAENFLAAYLAMNPDKLESVASQVDISYFEEPANVAIYAAVAQLSRKDIAPTAADILNALEKDDEKSHAARLMSRWDQMMEAGERPEASAAGAIRQLRIRAKEEELASERQALAQPGADTDAHKRRIGELTVEIHRLRSERASTLPK